jgi:serine O-acetyltransferase
MMLRCVRNWYGIELYPDAIIGRRFRIGHQSGIVIHRHATSGDDCIVRQGVTIGMGGMHRLEDGSYFRESAPFIGNRVDFGAGSKIVGKVTIGDDANIGPNAVVLTDVPESTSVFAPMSKMLRRRLSSASGDKGLD